MLELPPGCSAGDLDRLADWLEASVLADGVEVSKSELMEELQANGLALPAEESFGEDTDELGLDPDRKSTRQNSSHQVQYRMPSSA